MTLVAIKGAFAAGWLAVMPKRVIASVIVAAIVLAMTGVVLSVLG